LVNNVAKFPANVAGWVGKSREHMTDYGINYDKDKNPETDNSVRLNGSDWDYRAKSYMDNIDKIIRSSPGTLLSMPENGELHGAPVTTMVREYEIPDAAGNMHYTYGDVVTSTDEDGNEYAATANDDGTLNVRFTVASILPMVLAAKAKAPAMTNIHSMSIMFSAPAPRL
jgi:hypothetical protein